MFVSLLSSLNASYDTLHSCIKRWKIFTPTVVKSYFYYGGEKNKQALMTLANSEYRGGSRCVWIRREVTCSLQENWDWLLWLSCWYSAFSAKKIKNLLISSSAMECIYTSSNVVCVHVCVHTQICITGHHNILSVSHDA